MKLKTNDAINSLKEFYEKSEFAGGIRDSIKNLASDSSSVDAIWNGVKSAHMVDGKVSGLRIAGSAVGVSAAARIVSGGGIYRDKDGNANIIGIPFV